MRNLIILFLLSLFIVSCQEKSNFEYETSKKQINSLELRENTDIGTMHNNILESYFAEYGTDLDSVLYFNSRKELLLTRLINIIEQLGIDIDSSTNIVLSNIVDDLFCLYIGNLDAEENYKRLVEYQYDKLIEENIIDKDVATFIYSLSINPIEVSELTDTINDFMSENTLGDTEEEAINNFLDVYIASYTLWTEEGGSTPDYFNWVVFGADAWGGFVGGLFGTALGSPLGPGGSYVIGSLIGSACSGYMSYLVARSMDNP